MDMKIKSELIKQLRTQKAWSQEHLASASGLSLRTVQRIENGGACSLESKKAMASVFGLDATVLELQNNENSSNNHSGYKYGYAGAVFGLICAYSGISFSLLNNHISYGEAGLYYGATGALVGLCCGVIGYISNTQSA